jgi:DNA polymerase V
MNHPVAIVDCNNFYASCERVFNPKLKDKPIVVLSNNDGMIIARSNEAKSLGIPMGSPLFKIEDIVKKHDVRVFSSNYILYGDMSQRVMTTLEQFSPDIEIYSIDEAFINLQGFSHLDINNYAREIRETVKQWTGIPVSVGIAATKTLAKIANRFAKKHHDKNGILNLYNIPQKDIDSYLEQTDISDVWGVGRQYTKLLYKHGINNALQLKNADDKWIKKKMTVMGLRTVLELRGIPCIDYEYMPPPKKSIVSSRSFGRTVENIEEIKEAISLFTSIAAEKLRHQQSAANLLSVFLRTNPFKKTAQYHNGVVVTLPVATDITAELIEYAMKGVEQIYRPGFLYYKVGVMLSDIVPKSSTQFSLFDKSNRPAMAKVTEIMDTINNHYGKGTLFYARLGTRREWHTRADKRSARFTTDWNDLPEAKG